MNPYLSGIMALSQLSPEQFDMGMQRFQQIQQMQPQGLSALQARQAGLTADMNTTGQLVTASFGPSSGKQFDRNTTGRLSTQGPVGQAYTGEVRDSSGNVVRPALSPINQGPYSQPTMSPVSNAQGSFGTGAMPYTQPYYQRSFNPYSGGYGMGFGGGMPSYGGFGGGKGGGQPMYGGFGGGKGGRR